MSEMIKRSLAEHRRALDGGEYTSVELTRAYLDEIDRREGVVGAYLTLNAEAALKSATEADARISKGVARGALDGIPYALKDNFCTKGLRTTCASKMLEHFVPPYDASVVTRLNDAGAILLGKLNMDEFAMGSATETSALGVTRNPIDPDRVPGGSSGGSAAAVAAYEAAFSLGSDTGGSVRQPAAFCGVLGMKPTYGAISRYGMIAMASSLDCVGLVTHTADDCGAVLSCLMGVDERDTTTVAHPDPSFKSMKKDAPLRIAVVRELLEDEAVSLEVRHSTEEAIGLLRERGFEIGEVSLPSPDAALAAYCVISAAEAASNLARYDGIRFGHCAATEKELLSLYAKGRSEGFGSEVKRRILFGTYMMTEDKRVLYYDRALEARARIRERMLQILKQYDMILTPTTPTSAFRTGGSLTPMQRRRADLCAIYASLSGLPALSVPFGHDKDGLPLAIQLIGAHFCEGLLLQTAKLFEEVR